MKKIIIIGAGLGGLTAGNLLVKKRHQVTIFESHSTPGGYIAGFWRKGFYFESGAYGLGNSNEIFKTMKDFDLSDKISFKKLEPFRYVSNDFDIMPYSYQELRNLIFKIYPDEKARLINYFKVVDRMYNTFYNLMSKTSLIKKIISALEMSFIFSRYNETKQEFAERFFEKSSVLYRLLSHFTGYPYMSASMIGPYFWGPLNDYWTVKGGMQSWCNALAEKFTESGGDIKLKSPVDKILTKNNKVTGVTSLGNTYEADYIISACDYKKTFQKLLDSEAVPLSLLNKLEHSSVSEGWVVVYLGLSISGSELKKIMKSTHAHCYDLSSDADSKTDDEKTQDITFFDHCRIELYSPSLENPELAPQGKSSLMIMAISPYRWMSNWGNGDKSEYKKLKEIMCESLINRARIIIPNLYDLIEFKDAATPLTFERYTGNSDGATCCWSWNPHKKFYKNIWSSKVKTPIKNLLIGSAWSSQVGGTAFAVKAGKLCAKIIGD
ncbi:MAG: hypothetical protein A2086_03060 [Spirochaetes bacterium GWD1_27_9]|nr:MAG: hypothetical protein A2Z98_13975 [Spirochaetes bacterium GWB1_27_13]OHD26542.1 MAG: hypothetical protein A2Y34_17325 [Spirochaetes bacterium GWC1_27_15]OHD31364.1 MAG: hypothetical protein A2086_03060 [Spirochaetes bacterium GWD1_27_9]